MLGSERLNLNLKKLAKDEKLAIIETETDKKISYSELFNAVLSLRDFFGKPKKILVVIPGGIGDSVVWLSALTGGHLLIPVSPFLANSEYSKIIDEHQPDLIIKEKDLDKLEKIIKRKARESGKVKEGKVYLATSGSTGVPKGVILSATQIVITADNIRKSHKISDLDRGLTPLPFYHVNAPVVSLITSILSGSELIIAPKYSTSHFWEWVKKYDPTWISLVPTMIAMLLSTDKPLFLKNSSLKFIRTASEPLPAENLRRFERKFEIPIIETYGLSEAGSTIASNPVPPGKHKAGSVGKPLGVSLKICQVGSDKKVEEGEVGEVCIKGKNVIKNYENNLSAEVFFKGWFRTGDLGFLDKEGYLHLTGRLKDIIIRGGENIIPREIEEVLLSFPGVLEACVVGQKDQIYGEKVVAFLVLDEPLKDAKRSIKLYMSKKLASQKIPADLIILKSLPRNKTNKIDKKVLRDFMI